MRLLRPAVAIVVLSLIPVVALSAQITVEPSQNGAVVKIDGELFTEYFIKAGNKPILWPIIGPTGQPVTRDYPMKPHKGEAQDHIHQRSLWFTHGNVNGTNFWAEVKTATNKIGETRHLKFVKMQSGNPAVIVTQNEWLDFEGKKIGEDERTLQFGTDCEARWIDFDITIKATDGPITFADDKEGAFGVRVAHSISVDVKQGGKIINSKGEIDGSAWGKRAEWVDYHGPVNGKTVGIAIFNHPTSFRFPTYWHVRTYGLFAANPFGVKAFTGDKQADGSYTIQNGESITLRYRVYLHKGDEKVGNVAKAYEAYKATTK